MSDTTQELLGLFNVQALGNKKQQEALESRQKEERDSAMSRARAAAEKMLPWKTVSSEEVEAARQDILRKTEIRQCEIEELRRDRQEELVNG